jgi:hypothetical protein
MRLTSQHDSARMGLRDRLARRVNQRRAAQTQRRAAHIDDQRWAIIEPTIGLLEERVVNTPAYVFVPDDPAKAHPSPPGRAYGAFLFLTTKSVVVAMVDAPFSEDKPGVMPIAIAEIEELSIADNGALVMLGPGEESRRAGTNLSLYPSPFSQRWIAELRTRWEGSTGKEIRGNRGLTSWFGSDQFPVGLWEQVGRLRRLSRPLRDR